MSAVADTLTAAQRQLVDELLAARERKGRALDPWDWRRRQLELGLPAWWELHEHFRSISEAIAIANSLWEVSN